MFQVFSSGDVIAEHQADSMTDLLSDLQACGQTDMKNLVSNYIICTISRAYDSSKIGAFYSHTRWIVWMSKPQLSYI